jgi:hypothetical protein
VVKGLIKFNPQADLVLKPELSKMRTNTFTSPNQVKYEDMNRKTYAIRNTLTVFLFIFFVAILAGGLFWANLNYVQRVPISLDFLPLWKSANNLLMQGITPYGELTTYEIQKIAYGRAAGPGQAPLRISVPLPLFILQLPIGAFSDIQLARAIWMIVLQIGLAALVWFSIRIAQWPTRPFEFLFVLAFGIFTMPAWQALLTADGLVLLAVFLFGAVLALKASLDELAGMLMAFSFFQIETGGLLLLFLLFWVTIQSRWRVWAGLLMTLTLLFSTAFVIDPNWPFSFARAVYINWSAASLPSTFSLFQAWFPGLGDRIAWGLSFASLLLLMFESQQAIGRNALHWAWAACLAAAITPLAGLPVQPAGLVFLLPSFILVASVMSQRWVLIGRWVSFFILILFLSLSWLLFFFQIQSAFIWLSLYTVAALYWIRWWVARSTRLWADQISSERRGIVSF